MAPENKFRTYLPILNSVIKTEVQFKMNLFIAYTSFNVFELYI